jgi:hypothetical protein
MQPLVSKLTETMSTVAVMRWRQRAASIACTAHKESPIYLTLGCFCPVPNCSHHIYSSMLHCLPLADAKFVNAVQLQHTQAVGQEHQHQRLQLPTAMVQGLHN